MAIILLMLLLMPCGAAMLSVKVCTESDAYVLLAMMVAMMIIGDEGTYHE